MGAFRALDSGPLEAWFVDTVHETTPGADVDRQLSRAGSILGGAIAVGAVLSGAAHLVEPRRHRVRARGRLRRSTLAVWVSVALSVVHLVVGLRSPCRSRARTAGSERTRVAHALTEARQTPAVIKSGLSLLGRNRVLMGIVAAEVFWSIGMITFEAFMPLRLEEMVGSAQEAGALVGPVSRAPGWGLFSVGAWLAGIDLRPHRRRPGGDPGPGAQRPRGRRHGSGHRARPGSSRPTCSPTRCTA